MTPLKKNAGIFAALNEMYKILVAARPVEYPILNPTARILVEHARRKAALDKPQTAFPPSQADIVLNVAKQAESRRMSMLALDKV